MQYFQALKIGQQRIRDATALLKRYVENAMPAIALRESKIDGVWEPVGEENYVGAVKQDNGFIICICDNDGNAKAIASWYNERDKDIIIEKMKKDGLSLYTKKIKIPL
ncbi:MAG: hypothetical protein QW416_00555 [Candidatus Nitrosocaldaceae archaeon]